MRYRKRRPRRRFPVSGGLLVLVGCAGLLLYSFRLLLLLVSIPLILFGILAICS